MNTLFFYYYILLSHYKITFLSSTTFVYYMYVIKYKPIVTKKFKEEYPQKTNIIFYQLNPKSYQGETKLD